jgi:hypothetical protein
MVICKISNTSIGIYYELIHVDVVYYLYIPDSTDAVHFPSIPVKQKPLYIYNPPIP